MGRDLAPIKRRPSPVSDALFSGEVAVEPDR